MSANIRKLLVSALLISLILLLFPRTPLAETSGEFNYSISEGSATITRYTGSDMDVFIPELIDGYIVTKIDNLAFSELTKISRVTIPDSVLYIGYHAFLNCTGLTNITFGSGVKDIDQYAFYGCSSLTSLTVGARKECR